MNFLNIFVLFLNYNISNSFYYYIFVLFCCRILMIRILFLYQKSQIKKDKIGNRILSLAQGINKRNNHHIFMILQFLLIFNIKTIIDKYIYIEKIITKLVINDSKLQSKLLPKSLLSFDIMYKFSKYSLFRYLGKNTQE